MYTINARFLRFQDANLNDLIQAIGVYVIWDARAKARPTYLGEGNILKRFSDHAERDDRTFAHPWNGYVAIIDGSAHGVHKEESRAVECLLLDVAAETDRLPVVNAHPGAKSAVIGFCRNETLRIAISGFDPLLHPENATRLPGTKEIKARADGENSYTLEHDWRLPRLRAPVISRWES